ncbi:hypothetical protein TH25_21270 [Thalassospira profundimaris]|uniref:Uncharacterized protein n=1 Tax=Thalassospira profundimaris TaxID=502049 RepID=A0A367WSU5_9PROT|nr:hypothetical protein [Thalassospira profundimaris]RCK43680.1 hypothetical protein TH25_21270 [Thalassospira profundimaris]
MIIENRKPLFADHQNKKEDGRKNSPYPQNSHEFPVLPEVVEQNNQSNSERDGNNGKRRPSDKMAIEAGNANRQSGVTGPWHDAIKEIVEFSHENDLRLNFISYLIIGFSLNTELIAFWTYGFFATSLALLCVNYYSDNIRLLSKALKPVADWHRDPVLANLIGSRLSLSVLAIALTANSGTFLSSDAPIGAILLAMPGGIFSGIVTFASITHRHRIKNAEAGNARAA